MSKLMIVMVIGAVSGDSLVVRMNNEVFRAKIDGISTPAKGERFSLDAEQALAQLCLQKTATINYSEEPQNQTIKGKVKCGQKDVALEMVRAGWAVPTTQEPALLAEWDKAQQKKIGRFSANTSLTK